MKHNARGFTLIELVVTIAVLAMLLLLALPLTSAWADGAQQQTAANVLHEGIGRAKAQALLNPGSVTGTETPAAALCITNKTLSLHPIESGDSINCSSSSIWSAQLPDKPAVKVASNDFVCVAFNNRGLPVTPSGSSCTTSEIAVTVSSQDAINVPLI